MVACRHFGSFVEHIIGFEYDNCRFHAIHKFVLLFHLIWVKMTKLLLVDLVRVRQRRVYSELHKMFISIGFGDKNIFLLLFILAI